MPGATSPTTSRARGGLCREEAGHTWRKVLNPRGQLTPGVALRNENGTLSAMIKVRQSEVRGQQGEAVCPSWPQRGQAALRGGTGWRGAGAGRGSPSLLPLCGAPGPSGLSLPEGEHELGQHPSPPASTHTHMRVHTHTHLPAGRAEPSPCPHSTLSPPAFGFVDLTLPHNSAKRDPS